MFSKQQVEKLRKALALGSEANRKDQARFGGDKEMTGRWKRSVSQLGNRALEDTLQKELETLCPVAKYQFNISVCGASVHIWNHRIDLMSFASLEDLGGDPPTAILKTLTDLVEDFSWEPF